MVTKDLGLVTAYAYAVAGGYTGTEEEFQALLGNIAIDLAEIENLSVTVTTLPAGSSATASYDSGVLSLGIPKGDKGDSGDVANVAPEFSTSTAYEEGDYVIYNDLLYKFKTAKAAGAWDSTKVEAKTVGDELTALKEDINILGGFDKLKIDVTWNGEEGYINRLNGAVIAYSGWESTNFINIEGMTSVSFITDITTPSDANCCCFYSSPSIGGYIGWFSVLDSPVNVPANAKYMRLSKPSNNEIAVDLGVISVKELKEEVNILSGYEEIKIPWTGGTGYLNRSNGAIISYSGWIVSDWVNIDGLTDISFITDIITENDANCCCFYSSNTVGGYIDWFSVLDNPVFIPPGAQYMRLSKEISKSITVQTDFKSVQEINETLKSFIYNKSFVAIGDSITQGAGASTTSKSYFYILADKLKNDLIAQFKVNLGSGGSASTAIASFCGAGNLVITNDINIPATTEAVSINLNKDIRNVNNSVAYCNPCYLSGIKGALSYNNGYYFTRESAGSAKFVSSNTKLITYACKESINASILTIFVGTNDNIDANVTPVDTLVNNIEALTRLSMNGKYIVILPYVNSVNSDFRTIINNKYGERCIDLFNYMSTQSVHDAISEELIETGSQSNWLSIMTADGIHPNDIGHQLIAEQIYNRIVELDY